MYVQYWVQCLETDSQAWIKMCGMELFFFPVVVSCISWLEPLYNIFITSLLLGNGVEVFYSFFLVCLLFSKAFDMTPVNLVSLQRNSVEPFSFQYSQICIVSCNTATNSWFPTAPNSGQSEGKKTIYPLETRYLNDMLKIWAFSSTLPCLEGVSFCKT